MSAMASQITGFSIQPFDQARAKENIKTRVSGLCDRNPPMAAGFPSQRTSNAAENVSICWRHNEHPLHVRHPLTSRVQFPVIILQEIS